MKTEEVKTVAAMGSGEGKPGELMYDQMVEVGRLLAKKGITVATGAFGGAGMEAAPRGAKESGGTSVGYTLKGKPGNSFLTSEIDCQKLASGIPFFADFGIRFSGLMDADGFIIAAGGGAGTALELLGIIQFNRKIWKDRKRLAILHPASFDAKGWNWKMIDHFDSWGFLGDPGENVRDLIKITATPEQAVQWVTWQT